MGNNDAHVFSRCKRARHNARRDRAASTRLSGDPANQRNRVPLIWRFRALSTPIHGSKLHRPKLRTTTAINTITGREPRWVLGSATVKCALLQEPKKPLLQRRYRPKSSPTESFFRRLRAKRKSALSGGFSSLPTRTARNW